ncbi:MAG: DUF2225 domain-containing protein [Gemmatimonadaceae bacterium]
MSAPLRDTALQCPRCGTWFLTTVVASPMPVAYTRTDFHQRVPGLEPVAHLAHVCTSCGFAGVDRNVQSDPVGAASMLALRAPDARPLATETTTASERYETAAAIAEHQGGGAWEVAELYLAAAWCCVEERDMEAQRFFRRKAAWAFEEALSSYDAVQAGDRALLTYVVGALWRRSGDRARANAWFHWVAETASTDGGRGWLRALAVQQRDAPREWLTTPQVRAWRREHCS